MRLLMTVQPVAVVTLSIYAEGVKNVAVDCEPVVLRRVLGPVW